VFGQNSHESRRVIQKKIEDLRRRFKKIIEEKNVYEKMRQGQIFLWNKTRRRQDLGRFKLISPEIWILGFKNFDLRFLTVSE